MDTKIQELTDKIYKEGVEKGNEEAGVLISMQLRFWAFLPEVISA